MNQYILLWNVICDPTAKWAIQEVTSDSKDQFISPLFVLQQQNRTRLVFSLKPLNTFVESTKFKTEGLTPKRLHDGTGSLGHSLFDSNNERIQEISTLHVRQRNVQISVPTIRTLISPADIHQGSITRDFFTGETGL